MPESASPSIATSRVAGLALVLGMVILIGGLPIFASRPEQDAPARSRALLVGIQAYETPRDGWPTLAGPRADVELMRQTLLKQAGFESPQIRVLLDAAATRRRILAELDRMIRDASPKDLLLFYFAGHGSRLSDDDGEETDGIDETLVPFDAFTPDGARRNDIRDDEIEDWVRRANAKCRRVVLIFDSCHSGTVTRGKSGDITYREIRGFKGTRPSRTLDARARRLAEAPEPAFRDDGFAVDSDLAFVALGACRSHERAGETRVQLGGSTLTHGIFTLALCRELTRVRRGWTYMDLMHAVRASVRETNPRQTPTLVGRARDPLFGNRARPADPYFSLTRRGAGSDSLWTLTGGSLQGVRPRAMFHVLGDTAARDRKADRLGRVFATEVRLNDSTVAWTDAEQEARAKGRTFRAFPAGGGAGRRLPVALVQEDMRSELRESLERRIRLSEELTLRPVDQARFAIRERQAVAEAKAKANPGAEAPRKRIVEVIRADGSPLPIRAPLGSPDISRSIDRVLGPLEHLGRQFRCLTLPATAPGAFAARVTLRHAVEQRTRAGRKFTRGKPIAPDPATGIPALPYETPFGIDIENQSPFGIYAAVVVFSPDGAITPYGTAEEIPAGQRKFVLITGAARPKPSLAAFYEGEPETFRILFTADEPPDVDALAQPPIDLARFRSLEAEPAGTVTPLRPPRHAWDATIRRLRTFEASGKLDAKR